MNGSSDPFADGGDDGDSGNPLAALGALLEASPVAPLVASLRQRQRRLLDASTPQVGRRWGALAALVLAYALRVWSLQGFYIVTYALGIYNLNLLLGFLTPQVSKRKSMNWFSFFSFSRSIVRVGSRYLVLRKTHSNSLLFPFSLSSSRSPSHPTAKKKTDCSRPDRPRARGPHPALPELRRVPPLPAEAPGVQVLVGQRPLRRRLARRDAVPRVRRARLLANPAGLLLRAVLRDDAEAGQAHDQAQVYPVLAGELMFFSPCFFSRCFVEVLGGGAIKTPKLTLLLFPLSTSSTPFFDNNQQQGKARYKGGGGKKGGGDRK